MIAACLWCDLKFVGYRGVARHWAAQRKNNRPCREGGRSFSFRVMDPKDTTMGNKLCSRCYESENGTGLMCQAHVKEAIDKATAEQAAAHQQANEAWKKALLSTADLAKLANEDRASAEKRVCTLKEALWLARTWVQTSFDSPAETKRAQEVMKKIDEALDGIADVIDRWVPRADFDQLHEIRAETSRQLNDALNERDAAIVSLKLVSAHTTSQPLVESKEDLNAIRSAVVGTMAEVGIAMPESGPCSPAEVSAAIRRLAAASPEIIASNVMSVIEKALAGNHVDYTDERLTGAAKKITKLVMDLRATKIAMKNLEEIELRTSKEKHKLEDSIAELLKQREDVAILIKDAHKAVTGVRP